MKTIRETLQKSIILVIVMTIVCGLIYPVIITGITQLFFPAKANGSIIEIDGKKYGSELLGQQFTEDKYLWGRIMILNTDLFSGTAGNALLYAVPSNVSVAGKEFEQSVANRVDKIRTGNPDADGKKIPVDLVTCSGSGLDPHISYAAAVYQTERIAKSRNISDSQVRDIIDRHTTNRFVGVFGERVVNVLEVNLDLDGIMK